MLLLNFLLACSLFLYCRCEWIQQADQYCPPPELIAPCECSKDRWDKIVLRCDGFSSVSRLEHCFREANGWRFDIFYLENINMEYVPTSIFEKIAVENMNISSAILISLFDAPLKPITTKLYLADIKLFRGYDWSLLHNLNSIEFGILNGKVKSLNRKLKEGISNAVQNLYFDNTQTSRISEGAFDWENLKLVALPRNQIKTLKRNVFASPSNIFTLDLSFNKISSLPEDIFDDMPMLRLVFLHNNLLTTLSQRIFMKKQLWYLIHENPFNCDCGMRWLTVEGKLALMTLKGNCLSPESLKGSEIKDLKNEDFSYCN